MAPQFCIVALTACCLFNTVAGQYTAGGEDIPRDMNETLLAKLEIQSKVIEKMEAVVDSIKGEMSDMKQNLQEEQLYLKKHILNRLDALDEKTEWFLTRGQQGVHPLSNRISHIEKQLTQVVNFVTDRFTLYGLTSSFKDPKDCQEAFERGWTTSGVYRISPNGHIKINVYCEQELDGGGWMVFQKRQDGGVDFSRNWTEYKTGFGNLKGEFWLGNDHLHLLTKGHDQKLKIELKYNSETAYADYTTFWTEDESQKYKLHVAGFISSDPPRDSLSYQNQSGFSTLDQDNDRWSSGHCVGVYGSPWWHNEKNNECIDSGLNGVNGGTGGKGILWYHWKGWDNSLTGSRMMIKRNGIN